jgi:hypothetical protein
MDKLAFIARLEKENAEMKAVLTEIINALILTDKNGTGHISDDTIKRALLLCDIDTRMIWSEEDGTNESGD